MTVWNRYAATAARSHGKPGRDLRPKSVTIDSHCHIVVPKAGEFVAPHQQQQSAGGALMKFSAPDTAALNMQQDKDIVALMTQYDQRLKDMDRMGIDRQLVMPSPPQCYHSLPVDIAVPAARLVNDGIAEYAAGKPDRFIPCGTVPMQDGPEAAKELERIHKLGFRAIEVLTNVAGRELSDPAFAPFWKKAEELGTLVALHPLGFTHAERLSRFYFNNIIGNPLETTIALHYLIFDGVLERHPELKIFALHGGGYLGAYSGRIDHAWGARSDSKGNLPNPPTTYLKKVYFDTVVFTPLQLETLVKTFGVDHILLGTDYPFDMLEWDPVGHVASVESFDDATRAALCGGNAKRLLGL